MRNLKFIVTGVMVTAILVAGGVCLKNMFSKKEVKEEEIVTSEFIQNKSMDESKKEEAKVVTVQTEPLTIVSQEKKYFEEWKTENYEIVVKNTSGGYIRKISFTLGEGIYELYNLNPGESYKFVAFNTETDINLKVMSIVYDTINYNEGEIELQRNNIEGKVSGTITNKGERDLYPSQIIYFLEDGNGNTIQKVISYAGCFFEGLVIHKGETLDFEEEIPQGYKVLTSKGILVQYSDLEFKNIEEVLFN
jgi:hypothetical protein